MSNPNQRERAFEIVKLLTQNSYSTKELEQIIFGTNGKKRRTIELDLKFLIEYFGKESFIKEKRDNNYYYKIIDLPEVFSKVFSSSAKDLRRLYELVALFDKEIIKLFAKKEPQLIKQIQKENSQIFTFMGYPYEDTKPLGDMWERVKFVIKHRRYVDIIYSGKRGVKEYKSSKPLRILYANNNWYLMLYVPALDDIKRLRVSRITKLNVLQKSFSKTQEIKDMIKFIENMQSLNQKYKKEMFEVKVLFSKEVALNIKSKKYIKSQQIIKEYEDGSLLVRYLVNSELEILNTIRKFIPYMYIESPTWLKDKFKNMMKEYLKKL